MNAPVVVARPAECDSDAVGRYNDHYSADGAWCRWSLCHVSAGLAARADKRCPADCPDSSIELFEPPELLPCGCPKQLVRDCGHQEGCSVVVAEIDLSEGPTFSDGPDYSVNHIS